MVSLIAIPLKRTYDVDLVKPLKDVISSHFSANEDISQMKDSLNSLNKMRSNCTAKAMDIKHESSLEMLQKYNSLKYNLIQKCIER